ncbi:MAG: helix-turn-helix transcriptional regulator, partial [Candidatus Eremiobacteraeota bacterium]|nr:helix-turn-helix transcriptional regulator [Candidatus Eremiobacteraeota bacterium]
MPAALAELLHQFRAAAQLSQEALAERAGISARTVSDIETGAAKTPRLVTIMLLAEALSLSEGDRSRLQEAGRKPPARAGTTIAAAARALPSPIVLVGRDADLAELAALLSRNELQLLTIWGPPGVG